MSRRNVDYDRVLPRDLFNEAKLLKCLGRLCLLVHEDRCPGLSFEHRPEADFAGFRIRQDQSDASLSVTNLRFKRSVDSLVFRVYSFYNDKDAYPLYVTDPSSEVEFKVLDECGNVTRSFSRFLQGVPVEE